MTTQRSRIGFWVPGGKTFEGKTGKTRFGHTPVDKIHAKDGFGHTPFEKCMPRKSLGTLLSKNHAKDEFGHTPVEKIMPRKSFGTLLPNKNMPRTSLGTLFRLILLHMIFLSIVLGIFVSIS